MIAQKILVPTDFSYSGEAALEYAASLAKSGNGRLMIVHVQEPPVALGDGPVYYAVPLPTADDLLAQLRDVRPADPNVPVEHRLLAGDPADAVVKLADEEGVDLIVLGTHGRTGLPRLVMGSVAEAIVRRAHCPVLVCKQPVPKPAAAQE